MRCAGGDRGRPTSPPHIAQSPLPPFAPFGPAEQRLVQATAPSVSDRCWRQSGTVVTDTHSGSAHVPTRRSRTRETSEPTFIQVVDTPTVPAYRWRTRFGSSVRVSEPGETHSCTCLILTTIRHLIHLSRDGRVPHPTAAGPLTGRCGN